MALRNKVGGPCVSRNARTLNAAGAVGPRRGWPDTRAPGAVGPGPTLQPARSPTRASRESRVVVADPSDRSRFRVPSSRPSRPGPYQGVGRASAGTRRNGEETCRGEPRPGAPSAGTPPGPKAATNVPTTPASSFVCTQLVAVPPRWQAGVASTPEWLVGSYGGPVNGGAEPRHATTAGQHLIVDTVRRCAMRTGPPDKGRSRRRTQR